MARKRTKQVTEDTPIAEETVTEQFPESSTDFNPAEFDPALKQQAAEITQSFADSTVIPQSRPHIANPSSVRRESHVEAVTRRFPDKLTVNAGDLKVQLIDAGRNEMGIGIRVATPPGRTLTNEEKAIIRSHVRGEDGESSGFNWVADSGLWLKHILREGEHVDDVPPSRPVAIRLDAERRVQNLAEALREHAVDPVGYAEMVKGRREQAANSERIPD